MNPPAVGRPESRNNSIIRFALWAGLLTGLMEAAVWFLKRFVRHRLVPLGDDAFWMAPLAEALLFALVAGIVVLVMRYPKWRWRVALFLLLGLSAWSVLATWGRLHWIATLMIALGVGYQASIRLLRRWDRLEAIVRRTLLPLVLVDLVLVTATFGNRWWMDRRHDGSNRQPAGAPNVLLIILDTVRGFNLGMYGHQRATTPELDAWAERGTVIDRAMAPSSWTLPSHVMMFTGNWRAAVEVAARSPLREGAPTLAEVLGSHGYATGGFVGNLVYTTRATGLSRGFAHYEDYPLGPVEFFRSATLLRLGLDATRWKWATRKRHWFSWKAAPEVRMGAMRWIERQNGRPWFAFLNFMEAHDPWFVPAPFDTAFGRDVRDLTLVDLRAAQGANPPSDLLDLRERAYDGAIRYLDHEVALLLDSLRARGVLDSTIVIITSDHGEQFGDHGVVGHGTTLYRPVIQVPLLILAPGCAGGFREPGPVSGADLPATIMAFAGITRHPFPGHSFLDLVCGAKRPADPAVSILLVPGKEREGVMVSVVAGSLRYIRSGNKRELYDFGRDPWETSDLAGTPEGAAQVQRLNSLIDSLVAPGGP